MNKALKWVLISIGVAVGTVVGYYIFVTVAVAVAFGAFDPTYTKADLIQNYEARAAQIQALSTYINAITPAGKSVMIEFDGQRTIPIFHVGTKAHYSSNWGGKMGLTQSRHIIAATWLDPADPDDAV